MLSRAVLRSLPRTALRPTLRPSPIYTAISSTQRVRSFSKNDKPKSNRKPLTFGGTPVVEVIQGRSSTPAKTGKLESSPASVQNGPRSNDVDHSNKQEEFKTPASPSLNTAPQFTSPSAIDPAKAHAKDAVTKSTDASSSIKGNPQKSSTDFSKEQEEFQTAASPAANTAPRSTSPSAIDPAEAQQEQQPLPDLRQGLPSTIDFELKDAASKAKGAKGSVLNFTEEPSAEEGGGGIGGYSSYVSSADRKRQKLTNWAVLISLGMILVSPVYLGRNWESEEEEAAHPEAPSGFSLKLFFQRIMARINDFLGYYTDPAFTKLLPDADPMYAREYTLVLDLEDLLIHNEWTREHGWRLAKRPGVDYFLRYLQQYYELVIWTTQPFTIAEVVVLKLDPYHLCQPLFREATAYSKGEHIKDLSFLNRDPSKVIVLETNPASVQRQPENAIIVKKFEGDSNDKELVSLIPFLEYIPAMRTKDVREVIKAFEGTHIPTEYAKREAIARKRFEAKLEEERKKHPRSGLGWGARALGIKPQPQFEGDITFAEALASGKMIQDIYRERGQREYERFDKLIRTEGPKWLAEEAAMAKKMQEEMMKSMNPMTKLGLSPPSSADGAQSPSPSK